METSIIAVDIAKIGDFTARPATDGGLDEFKIDLDYGSEDAQRLLNAAHKLRTSDVPVAFPTETVYGLGADATRSEAVKGIYKAKQRPSDNPLIVHFASVKQLTDILAESESSSGQDKSLNECMAGGLIPATYQPLISRFWPGPLTIILPTPNNTRLAPEVTAGLSTFGARIPRHPLALALIQLAGVPVAAPSANASTKPSPTAAEHVALDLNGRIETIVDGGPCDVGVESTVVDGLSDPPLILRPGGVSLEQIRECPGWEHTQPGYQNTAEMASKPKAPGMKYRHYSPKATVILYECGLPPPRAEDFAARAGPGAKVGIVRTTSWAFDQNDGKLFVSKAKAMDAPNRASSVAQVEEKGFAGMLQQLNSTKTVESSLSEHNYRHEHTEIELYDIDLGPNTTDIARGIFSSLRRLDSEEVSAIFVEGIDEAKGETAAAIMNRLRKAAEIMLDR